MTGLGGEGRGGWSFLAGEVRFVGVGAAALLSDCLTGDASRLQETGVVERLWPLTGVLAPLGVGEIPIRAMAAAA